MIINYTDHNGDHKIDNVICICISCDREELAYMTKYDIETQFLSLIENTVTSIIQNQ